MPATSCMAVCVPAEQNETFTVSDDSLTLNVDEDGVDIVSCETDSLLPLATCSKNGHIGLHVVTHYPVCRHPESIEPLLPPPSSALARSFSFLPIIPESEHGELASPDVEDYLVGENGDLVEILEDTPEEEPGDWPGAPAFTRVVREEDCHFGSEHDQDTAQLFRDLLQLSPSDHVAFSGADSHQYLFQHFDAETLEFEEAAAVRPKFIGHYLLGDCLGEGSYAKVKEALNTETLERAAVKIFSPVKLKRIPNGMQNVLKEVNILRKLNHPNVCRMKELLKKELKKKLYLIMDYAICAISDLVKTLPQERLPAWKAHYYFLQLLDGLQYCHSRGVIHKDLKPSNLVITTQDTLKIIDFGVAEQLSPYAATDLICSSQGCPAVQPPEVADGVEMFSGFKLDVWSCGVTFFSLCVGDSRFPFVGETVYELFANISERPHELPKELRDSDPEFCLLIDAMLQKKEANRPSLDELRHHAWVRRHWPMPPAGVPIQELIEQAEDRSVESFLPYIEAYCQASSNRTSRAGSICCTTGGRVPHHHHHYPRCHSHHLTPHNSTRTCRWNQDRRRSLESRHLTHNSSIRSIQNKFRERESYNNPHDKAHDMPLILPPVAVELDDNTADQGCFSFKKQKICRIT